MHNRFTIALDLFGDVPSYTDLDIVTVLTLLARMYEGGRIGYCVPDHQSIKAEVIGQLLRINEQWAGMVSQRLIGRAWDKRICDIGVPIN